MINFVNLPDTTHSYAAVNNGSGAQTHDDNETTHGGFSGSDSASGSGGSFAGGGTLISSHAFAGAVTVKQMKFKCYASVSSNSSTDNAARCSYALQYQIQGDSTWYNFTGGTGSAGSGSGGGSNSGSFDTGLVTINEIIQNVVAVRLTVTNGGSFHNDNGSHSWDLKIQEIQAYGDAGGYAVII